MCYSVLIVRRRNDFVALESFCKAGRINPESSPSECFYIQIVLMISGRQFSNGFEDLKAVHSDS
jgi:hypothetical protein